MDQRMTISGVLRGEHRRIYLRKETWTAENNVAFLVSSYEGLEHNPNGRLLRNVDSDTEVIKELVRDFKGSQNGRRGNSDSK